MPSYTTLQSARAQLQVSSNAAVNLIANDDAAVARYLVQASQMIEDYCGQNFDERFYTYNFSPRIGDPTLEFYGRPCLTVTTVTNGDGTVIPPSGYLLFPSEMYPIKRIVLQPSYYWAPPSSLSYYNAYQDPDRVFRRQYRYGTDQLVTARPYATGAFAADAIKIAGTWGFHRNYRTAWLPTGLKTGGTVAAGARSITLNATAGLAIDAYSVIRIDSEQFLVTGPIASSTESGFNTTTITVTPAYNNSTPATHAADADIYVWQPEPVVQQATDMLVAALYAGRANATGDSMIVDGAVISAPKAMPSKIKEMLPSPYWRVHNGQ